MQFTDTDFVRMWALKYWQTHLAQAKSIKINWNNEKSSLPDG